MSIFPPPSQTRLVTIIAQVDHGKTTLADSLIESNGIISERLAGTLRYLDDLQEEQRRGITIRTSAIGLQHEYQKTIKSDALKMVIHVLDSPGHADFCTEVSSALQCCDGALLVVDAVEGLCARTHQVLREAFVNQLIPILVINKVDRLCTELCLTEEEAYLRLRKLLESMNAASSAMLTSSRADETVVDNDEQQEEQDEEEDDPIWNFDPTRGNVVFCSAIHGWGFTVPALARDLFRSKQIEGIKPPILKQYLFGDYKYRDGKVLKWKPDTDELPMFGEYGLKPIWQLYQGISQAAITCGLGSNLFGNAAAASTTTAGAVKITATTCGMDLVQEVLGNNNVLVSDILQQTGSSTEDAVLSAILRRYRPLSTNVLNAVCDKCPSPAEASASVRTRALALQPGSIPEVEEAVRTCCTDPSSPTVAHVCKFLTTDRSNVQRGLPPDESDDDDPIVLMGVARVLCGVLTSKETYSCLGPKHVIGTTTPQRTIQLYLLMGSSLIPVDQVPAGHLCAVYGLEDLQLQTVTLSSSTDCMPLQGFNHGVRPLVKVNVEPVHAEDAAALERGLVKLTMADAAVEVTATAKGERIVACLGEIHLEQSLLDLKTTYYHHHHSNNNNGNGEELQLRISKPIVEFGETTDWFEEEATDYGGFFATKGVPPLRHTTIPPYNEEEGIRQARRGRTRAYLSGKSAAVAVRVVPLDPAVYQAFQSKTLPSEKDSSSAREEVLKFAKALGCATIVTDDDDDDVDDTTFASMLTTLRSMGANGNILLESRGISSGSCVKGVIGDQVYYAMEDDGEVDEQDENEKDQQQEPQEPDAGLEEYQQLQETVRQGGLLLDKEESEVPAADQAALDLWKSQLSGSIVAGFQLGLRAGPICEEPVHQVCVILESVELALSSSLKPSKPLSGGMVIGALKQGIRSALLSRPARLMEGHLKLTLHSSLNALGSLYAVLSKRRGKVLHDDMVEGTDLLLITATLPQAESYGLAPELLRKTSGQVTVPELTFYAVSRLEENPFWIPQSLEEREDFGEILTSGDASTGVDNTALTYIRQVRERKGLLVDSNRTVVAAEKQRTMKR